jgi:adenylate cyclase
MKTELQTTMGAPAGLPASKQGLVLIVDDDKVNRLVVRKPLELEGFEVVEAANGREAAQQVAKRTPDVILLDVMMPGINGYEVCRLFKSNQTTATIPILMVTVLGEREQRLQGIEAGANDFLTKPVDVRELKLRVRNAVHMKQLYDQLKAERQRSEELLLNVLPRTIAERMKLGERDIAEYYPDVTILIANLSGLTELASLVAPEQVVYLLTELFSSFDSLVEARGLEKIKTFGSQYMAAGGPAFSGAEHAEATVELALDLKNEVAQFNAQYHTSTLLRIGICTGPVVGGVIGRKKFAYDLWGGTVNEATRLQAQAGPDEVRIAGATYEQLPPQYALEAANDNSWLLTGRI